LVEEFFAFGYDFNFNPYNYLSLNDAKEAERNIIIEDNFTSITIYEDLIKYCESVFNDLSQHMSTYVKFK
jgi:hypothetical protein